MPVRERSHWRSFPAAKHVGCTGGVDAVIHSAGATPAMSGVPEDDYRVLNTERRFNLARAAGERERRLPLPFLHSRQCGPTANTVLTEAVEPEPT